jgi:hypothetical protein
VDRLCTNHLLTTNCRQTILAGRPADTEIAARSFHELQSDIPNSTPIPPVAQFSFVELTDRGPPLAVEGTRRRVLTRDAPRGDRHDALLD